VTEWAVRLADVCCEVLLATAVRSIAGFGLEVFLTVLLMITENGKDERDVNADGTVMLAQYISAGQFGRVFGSAQRGPGYLNYCILFSAACQGAKCVTTDFFGGAVEVRRQSRNLAA